MNFFVSKDGNDQWSGTLDSPAAADGPFASLERSRDTIRKLKLEGKLNQPVEVQVREGTYYLAEPLQFWGADSGTEQCPITYTAYPGETPVLSGGRRISEWQPYKDKIVCAGLPEVRAGRWWFRQLFFNGRRMIRSRRPKVDPKDPLYGGWTFIEAPVPETNELDSVKKIDLDRTWRFKTDPQKAGATEKWFAPDTPDGDWPQLSTGQVWDMQGYKDYHGTAWYRTRFKMPGDFDTQRHLWLLFGAVSKEAHVYIDGRKVFERTGATTGMDPNALWDKPFKFDARPLLQPGHEHSIAVRVDSEAYIGGIWRSVSLVSTESDVLPESLIGIVENAVAFRYEKNVFPHRWAKPGQAEVFVLPGKSWISDIIPVKDVDFDRRTIHLTRPVGPTRNTLTPCNALTIGNRFYVENNLEDLDRPGEWCLDTDTGTVYFWPPEGDVETGEITAPAIVRLIEMIGTQDEPVRHITLRGFTLTQTQAQFPTPETYYKKPNAGQTLYMENTQDCAVDDNLFDSVGGDAIRLQNNNARNRIAGNEIKDAGAYGIFLGGMQHGFCRSDTSSGDLPSPTAWHRDFEDRDVAVKAWPRSKNHLIHNNHIHHVGIFEKHACGIAFFGISAADVVVSHNLIHHTPRFGIGLMSGFGRVTIEHNEIHHVSLETCDTGGICANRWYTYENDPDLRRGNIIRFNYIRDVIGCGAYEMRLEPDSTGKRDDRIFTPYYSWAIYFDNGPMDVHVYGNICARNTLGGIMISHYAQDITVENNIFVDSGQSQVYLALAGDTANVRFRKNIFSFTRPEADFMRMNLGLDVDLARVITEFDKNLFFPEAGGEVTFSGLPGEAVMRTETATQEDRGHTLESWREIGYDRHSVVADPLFMDPANDNYDLAPDSPALELGFEPIDTGKIGLIRGGGTASK